MLAALRSRDPAPASQIADIVVRGTDGVHQSDRRHLQGVAGRQLKSKADFVLRAFGAFCASYMCRSYGDRRRHVLSRTPGMRVVRQRETRWLWERKSLNDLNPTDFSLNDGSIRFS